MFEFTTQTVFNNIVKTTEAAVRAKSAPKGYNIIVKDTAQGPEVRIGNTRFNKNNVIDIQIKNHTVENLAKVEIDLANVITLVTADSKDVQEGSYRIVLYVGLSMNSQDSFYANPFVYKGKPFFIEFPITAADTATTAAARLVKIANKYLLFTAQEKILDVTASEGKVTFEATNGYQIFKQVLVQKYDPNASQIDCCNNNGDFVTIMTGVPVTYTTDPQTGEVTVGTQTLDSDGLRDLEDNEVAIEPGIEAFLDYNWMTHNLRLPTLANTNWWTANKSELPIVGGEYTQFIIRMCAKRLGVSGSVVGHETTSVTTHVLYVLDQGNNVATVKQVLGTLATAKTDADTALADPYAGAQ